MCAVHTPVQQYRQALQIAKDNNMFIVDKGDLFFLVYRKTPVRNVLLGQCRGTDALFRKVSRCAKH